MLLSDSFVNKQVSAGNRYVHAFFCLLEQETALVSSRRPIRIRTAKEFAGRLFVHPNYLNVLLKKHTGKNISAHIKGRLLEESKLLLVETDWTLEMIGHAIGFSDQPNFSQFFKKSMGITPSEYRRAHTLLAGVGHRSCRSGDRRSECPLQVQIALAPFGVCKLKPIGKAQGSI